MSEKQLKSEKLMFYAHVNLNVPLAKEAHLKSESKRKVNLSEIMH